MNLQLRIATIIIDFFLILSAFILAYFVRVGFIFSTDFHFRPYFYISVLTAAVWIGFLVVARVYRLSSRTDRLNHFVLIAVTNVAAIAVFALLYYGIQKEFFSRLLLAYSYMFATLGLILVHFILQKWRNHKVIQGHGVKNVLIIGSNRKAKSLVKRLLDMDSAFRPVAVVDGYGTSVREIAGVPVVGKLNKLESTIDDMKIDEVIQVDNLEQTLNIISVCQQYKIGYKMDPSLHGIFHNEVRVDFVEDIPVIGLLHRDRSIWDIILGH
jgi:FlaA1/EpsC-like NDP-sugar epimerase